MKKTSKKLFTKMKTDYKMIIIDKNGNTYKKIYKNKPPVHKDSNRKLPKNIDKMFSLAYIMRLVDGYTMENYNNLPDWKYV